MDRLSRQRRKPVLGFTLIELLVAALIASIFLAATAGIVVQTMRIDREETGRSQVQAELAQAMQYIQQDLAEALYIYNDAEQRRDANGNPVLGDGIPDLIQNLYTPGWIRRPDGSIPVVAFWKLSPIPQDCYERPPGSEEPPTLEDIRRGNVKLKARPSGISEADWENLKRRRNIYTLVVYYLRRNYNDAGNLADGSTIPWEGNARIVRFELEPFNTRRRDREGCTQRNNFFKEDPDPFQVGFLNWPQNSDPQNLQVPIAQQREGPNPIAIASNIFSSRQDSPQVAPPCPEGYAFGGGRPAGVTFTGLGVNQNDLGFYVCVRRSASGKLPQDVIINITATAMERSNPGLFRRYIQDATSVDAEQISRYLTTMQTRVLARGVINREA